MRNVPKLLLIVAIACAVLLGIDGAVAQAGNRYYKKPHRVARQYHKAVVHAPRPVVHVAAPGVRVHVGPPIHVHAYPGVSINVAPRYRGFYYGW